MELSHEDVAAILDLVERSNVEYLEVEVGGTRLVADRSGTTVAARGALAPAAPAPPPGPPAVAAPPAAPPAPAPLPPAPAPVAAPTPLAAAAAGPAGTAGLVTVPAPMVGVFYRAPEPGAPPFVEVGSTVEAGATMGLVEVMKMFNSVTAAESGEVVEILVENDDFVEFGQPLFTIRPIPA
jgi:acetyl-CoA carboxylase biotin carboxyl carrier protein